MHKRGRGARCDASFRDASFRDRLLRDATYWKASARLQPASITIRRTVSPRYVRRQSATLWITRHGFLLLRITTRRCKMFQNTTDWFTAFPTGICWFSMLRTVMARKSSWMNALRFTERRIPGIPIPGVSNYQISNSRCSESRLRFVVPSNYNAFHSCRFKSQSPQLPVLRNVMLPIDIIHQTTTS